MKQVKIDLEMAKLKAAEARRHAAIARNSANLALEYLIDCEALLTRALERGADVEETTEQK
jgi:hypothetical protein